MGPAPLADLILFHIHDERRSPPKSRALGTSWSVQAVPLGAHARVPSNALHCLIDVDVTGLRKALLLRDLMARMPAGGKRIFACEPREAPTGYEARALGATHVVDRPIRDALLLRLLSATGAHVPESTVVASVALDLAFQSIAEAKPLLTDDVAEVATSIARDIEGVGIERWLDSIREHHRGTYQHCLIVTGLASAFGRRLGLSASDLEKLTVAALLHDIGKARIDPAILDKNGPLTPAEREIVEMHPIWGAEHLDQHGDVSATIRDCIRHHHELLDGSGYPDGLKGDQISDLTRLLTIVDIFGALVERRAYKAPMSGEAAFRIIDRMTQAGKLERALVEAFRPVAAELKDETALSRSG